MNTANPEKKEKVMRSLAVAGLVAIIFFIAWLAIQIVNVAPSAFSSLASLADGISEYEKTIHEQGEPLVVVTDTKLAASGEVTTLSWDNSEEGGSYTLSHACIDDVKVSVLNEDGVRDIECDTNYNIGNTDSIVVFAKSEENRYVDIPYTITYSRETDRSPYRTGLVAVTVINKNVADTTDIAEEDDIVLDETNVTDDSATETPDDTTSESTGGYSYEFEYKIPTSNPNGYTDLAIKFVSIGGIVNQKYTAGKLEQDSTGAVQFEVKNIGTKTSEDWKFSITLPDGSTYTSETQAPLKPNERATLTIGIQTENDSSHTFIGRVTTDNDRVSSNNRFSQTVTIQG